MIIDQKVFRSLHVQIVVATPVLSQWVRRAYRDAFSLRKFHAAREPRVRDQYEYKLLTPAQMAWTRMTERSAGMGSTLQLLRWPRCV